MLTSDCIVITWYLFPVGLQVTYYEERMQEMEAELSTVSEDRRLASQQVSERNSDGRM